MSKNIDEIGLTKYCGGCSSSEYQQRNYADQGRACCPDGDQKYYLVRDVKQALTEKKLCKPLSYEEIQDIIGSVDSDCEKDEKDLADLLYQAQFKGDL